MRGALESLDDILAGLDGGTVTALAGLNAHATGADPAPHFSAAPRGDAIAKLLARDTAGEVRCDATALFISHCRGALFGKPLHCYAH